jgi:hypothetical protein
MWVQITILIISIVPLTKKSEKGNNVDWPYVDTPKEKNVDTLLGTFPNFGRFLVPNTNTFCWKQKVLGTKNSSGHVQTKIFFWKSSQLFVLTLFPAPCRLMACWHYSRFPKKWFYQKKTGIRAGFMTAADNFNTKIAHKFADQ